MAEINLNLSAVDYTTTAPGWPDIWRSALDEFKRWIVNESAGELCGEAYHPHDWEQTTYGERVTWRAQRLAGVTVDVDGAAFAIFHADLIPTRSGRAEYKFKGELHQWRGGYKKSKWTYTPPPEGVPVITYTPEQLAEMRRQAIEQAERDRIRRERESADRLRVFKDDLTAYFCDTLPLAEAPDDAEGVAYLRMKRVPLDILPDVRAAKTERSTPTGYIFRRGERPLAPHIRAGALVVPMYDVRDTDKMIVAFQWIQDKQADDHGHRLPRPNGKNKRFRENSNPKALPIVHWIGDPRGAAVVAMAEGLATAATWYQLTGVPTGSTCDVGQLEKTAAAWLKANPRGRLIVAADDDFLDKKTLKFRDENPGRSGALNLYRADPARVYVARPPWPREAMHKEQRAGLSDWNDYYNELVKIYKDEAEGLRAARADAYIKLEQARAHFKAKER